MPGSTWFWSTMTHMRNTFRVLYSQLLRFSFVPTPRTSKSFQTLSIGFVGVVAFACDKYDPVQLQTLAVASGILKNRGSCRHTQQ